MKLKEEILDYLIANPHEYVSGEQMAELFGKSRAAVWKCIKSLQNEGYQIEAVTNRGYRLSDNNDIISEQILKSKLESDIDVFYFPKIDSTNTQATRWITKGYNKTALIVADEQTDGRGRQGKSFYSPPLTGIYFTVVVHPNTSLQNVVSSTTAASVAVCKALENLTNIKPQIKWVNDVYVNDKKICGILTEAISDLNSNCVTSVIVGIGMNIKTIDFPKDVEAGCLNADVKRADLICEITKELLKIVNNPFNEFMDYYRSHSMIIGKKINFIENHKVTPATAISIEKDGGLVVELEDKSTRVLRSGEISIRKIDAKNIM